MNLKRSILVLLAPMVACLTGFTAVSIPPDARIKLSAWSERILLIEITKVTTTDEKVADGLGRRTIQVEGKVIELIRGEQKSKTFHASKMLTRMVDETAASAKYDATTLMVLKSAGKDHTGITECKEGNRYVVNFTGSDCLFPNEFFFSEVSKDNDDWRKKILPRRHSDDDDSK